MTSSTSPITAEIAEQAMHWHFELQEPEVSPATLAAWMAWRQAQPMHEHAWQRAEAFAQRMGDLRNPSQRRLAQAALRPDSSRRSVLKQLSVLMAAGASAWYMKDTALVQDFSADYHSRVGEQRRISLAGDTELQLNTDTAINVATEQNQRRIQLLRGELLITRSNASAGRLLSVHTAQGRLEAQLAQFNVRQRAGLTQVSVYRGELVFSPALLAHPPIILQAGERATFAEAGIVSRQPEPLAIPAWSQGMLVAQDQPLAEFIAELSRYRRGHLTCDPALARLRVSGTFPLADTDKVILAVANTLQLEVEHFTRYWVTLKPRIA